MNAVPKNTGSTAKTVVGFVIFVIVIIALYYLYQFLYGTAVSNNVTILSGTRPITGSTAVTDAISGMKAVAITQLTGVMDNGAFSVNFWTYISDAKAYGSGSTTSLAHLMDISDRRFAGTKAGSTQGKTLVYVGLNPMNGSLVVRQSTSDSSSPNAYQINNSLGAAVKPTSTSYSINMLESGYNSAAVFKADDRCDIVNGIEFQRWIMISVIGNGRTLDVYLDGKLARSCVYAAGNYLGSTAGAATAYFATGPAVGQPSLLKGYLSNGAYFNVALTPDLVWQLYQAGPTGNSSSIANLFSSIFNTNIVLGSTAGLNGE